MKAYHAGKAKTISGITYPDGENGRTIVIHFLAMSGSAVQEPIVQNYIQQWRKIGLHVSLAGGRLTEFNSFYAKLDHDDKASTCLWLHGHFQVNLHQGGCTVRPTQ